MGRKMDEPDINWKSERENRENEAKSERKTEYEFLM